MSQQAPVEEKVPSQLNREPFFLDGKVVRMIPNRDVVMTDDCDCWEFVITDKSALQRRATLPKANDGRIVSIRLSQKSIADSQLQLMAAVGDTLDPEATLALRQHNHVRVIACDSHWMPVSFLSF